MPDEWGEDADPVEDMRAAIERLSKPTPKEYYEQQARIERAIVQAQELLIDGGFTPEAVAEELVRADVWPQWPPEKEVI